MTMIQHRKHSSTSIQLLIILKTDVNCAWNTEIYVVNSKPFHRSIHAILPNEDYESSFYTWSIIRIKRYIKSLYFLFLETNVLCAFYSKLINPTGYVK